MGDYVEQTLRTIARVEAQFKPPKSPSNDAELDLLRQLDHTKRVLHGFSPAVEAHQLVRRELCRAVAHMEAMARDHWWKHYEPEAKWREHFLESLLDVRWWTMVLGLQGGEEFTGIKIASLMKGKGVSSYLRHFPSYGFEITADCRIIFREDGDMAFADVGWPVFAVEDTSSEVVDEAASPLINEELTLDLTEDVLGVSRTGSWVIRTTYEGVDCALKRATSRYPPVYSRLSHPHVVLLMHYWWKEEYLFLMMELMDGDLTDVLRKGSLRSLLLAVDILLQIAKGMLYLHDNGISYPLSCANVLFRECYLLQDGHMEYIIKLAGGVYNSSTFGWLQMTADVHRFGSLCLEVLNGRPQREDSMDLVLDIPEGIPQILRHCITRCLQRDFTFGFEQVVTLLLLAKCQVLKGGKDDSAVGSQGCETVQLGLDNAGTSSTDNAELQEYPLYQLYPEPDVSNLSTTLIFFHGFAKSPDEWKSTWMTRNREHVWPEAWLPKDLPQVNVRILSLSYDTDASAGGEDVGAVEIAKKVLRQLLSSKWNLADPETKVVLIGHSYGGLIIKRLVVEAHNQVSILSGRQESCMKFLENLKGIVFYGVPGSATDQSQQFEEYITKLNETGMLKRSSLMQALLKDRRSFNHEMQVLGSLFEKSVPEKTRILHFIEGKGMKKLFGKQVVVSDASAKAQLKNVVFHELKEDNHFEVCLPVSKNHKGYKILVEEFLKDILLELGPLNPETGGSEYHQLETGGSEYHQLETGGSEYHQLETGGSEYHQLETGGSEYHQLETGGSEYHQLEDVSHVGKESCLQEAASPVRTSRKTLSSSFEPSVSSGSKSQRSSVEQSSPRASKTVTQFRGVKYREELNKYVSEIRPSRSTKKIWLGMYDTAEEAARAFDIGNLCCKENLPLNFEDSPRMLSRISSELPPKEEASAIAKLAKVVARMSVRLTSDDKSVEQKELDRARSAMNAHGLVREAQLGSPEQVLASGSAAPTANYTEQLDKNDVLAYSEEENETSMLTAEGGSPGEIDFSSISDGLS